jgi:hypothetical protein
MRPSLTLISLALLAAPAAAQQADIGRIVDEGLNRSQVMQTAQELTDGIGGRMTNSPAMRKAEGWAIDKFTGWGLRNVHRDGYAFGRGWSFDTASMTMLTPRRIPLRIIPIAWTPGTNGLLRGEIIVAPMSKVRHFEAWRGKLRGKVVLVSLPGEGSEPVTASFRRLSKEEIDKLDTINQPKIDPEAVERSVVSRRFEKQLDEFLKAEGALGWGRISQRDGGLVHGTGYNYQIGNSPVLPGFEIAAEDYRRLARIAKVGPAPTVEMLSDARYDDSDANAYNILAEIPGTDPRAGYVLAGAHLDSWVASDGAVDNGAGSAMIMEAARILAKLGVRPKRTIRFALWTGEEQGLTGSLAYVQKYLAERPPVPADQQADDRFRWPHRFPITKKPGFDELVAYFNIDNGSGKLRGIYAENNIAAVPMLEQWLKPFDALGAGKVVMGTTGGTDHMFLQSLGLPAFQFVQDPLDYGSRLHHTSIDSFDHLKADDMRQGAVVLAGVLLQAANSDKALPREPLPSGEVVTDPFKYEDPSQE